MDIDASSTFVIKLNSLEDPDSEKLVFGIIVARIVTHLSAVSLLMGVYR